MVVVGGVPEWFGDVITLAGALPYALCSCDTRLLREPQSIMNIVPGFQGVGDQDTRFESRTGGNPRPAADRG